MPKIRFRAISFGDTFELSTSRAFGLTKLEQRERSEKRRSSGNEYRDKKMRPWVACVAEDTTGQRVHKRRDLLFSNRPPLFGQSFDNIVPAIWENPYEDASEICQDPFRISEVRKLRESRAN